MRPPISVYLVEDHPVFRAGLKAAIEGDPQFVVLGEATDGVEAVRSLENIRPDILTIDISMPQMNGLKLVQHLRQRQFVGKLVVMTVHED